MTSLLEMLTVLEDLENPLGFEKIEILLDGLITGLWIFELVCTLSEMAIESIETFCQRDMIHIRVSR